MSAVPLFGEIRHKAVRTKTRMVVTVMMADDSIRTVEFGPRGGWKFVQCPVDSTGNSG